MRERVQYFFKAERIFFDDFFFTSVLFSFALKSAFQSKSKDKSCFKKRDRDREREKEKK
jgi:hypothetical protein